MTEHRGEWADLQRYEFQPEPERERVTVICRDCGHEVFVLPVARWPRMPARKSVGDIATAAMHHEVDVEQQRLARLRHEL